MVIKGVDCKINGQAPGAVLRHSFWGCLCLPFVLGWASTNTEHFQVRGSHLQAEKDLLYEKMLLLLQY